MSAEAELPRKTFDYLNNDPIDSEALDLLGRAPFARRVAETILARRHDSSSLVIGIYGSWGSGKSSVLELMAKELRHPKHIGKPEESAIVVRFNPWYFNDESELIRSFFATLADAVERVAEATPESVRKQIGEKIREYGQKAAPLLTNAAPLISIIGAAVPFVSWLNQIPGLSKALGDALAPSQTGLGQLRGEIDSVLAASERPVVVLIDDIDRLDTAEIQAVMKLVKLSADFKNTTYVLSFDDTIVAKALAVRYGEDKAGKGFLEKIVQVPLHLPAPDGEALSTITLNGVREALRVAGISLEQPSWEQFTSHFSFGLSVMLTTPRVAKRYANALLFALPLLKGEVNVPDLMLLEGIRIFHPDIYEAIRDHPSVFLQSMVSVRDLATRPMLAEKRLESDRAILVGLLEKLPGDQRRSLEFLLHELFPQTSNLLSTTSTGYGQVLGAWTEHKRLASPKYFPRYFAYAIPHDDMRDVPVADFIARLPLLSLEAAVEDFYEVAGGQSSGAISKMLDKLSVLTANISENAARQLIPMVARVGNREGVDPGTIMYLIRQMLDHIPSEEARIRLAEEALDEAKESLYKHYVFGSWERTDEDKALGKRPLPDRAARQLHERIAEPIRQLAREGPLYLARPGTEALLLLRIWKWHSSPNEVQSYLQDIFAEDARQAVIFLQRVAPPEHPQDPLLRQMLDRRHYDSLSEVIDPPLLISFLKTAIGEVIEVWAEIGNDALSAQEHAAHRFVSHFRARMKQSSVEDQQAEPLMTVEEDGSADNAETTRRDDSGE